MLRLLVLTDDFISTLDTEVRFAARGTPTQILTARVHRFTEGDAEVLVIDTETRHLSPKEAGKVVYALTEGAIHVDVSCIYKETDSALHGNVGAELEATLSRSGESVFPFLPAFPELGQATVEGHQYINGIPANENPLGRDPFEPVRTAGVATLLGLQSNLLAESFPPLEANGTVPSRRSILIFDAGNEEELFANGGALFRDTVPWMLAGCTEFAAYLPELLGLDAREGSNLSELSPGLLILCGSINPITRRQLSIATDEGFGHMYLTPQGKVLPDFFTTAVDDVAFQALQEQLREHPRFIIDGNDVDDNTETENYTENLGLSLDELRFRIANALGTVLAELIREPAPGILLLIGDDTLLQCISALGVRKMGPAGELRSGVMLCRFSYRGKEHVVITESGEFGEGDLLPRLARFLEKKAEGGKR